jgi:glycosyltransferase involved in cell wall biosynthesis
MKLESDLIVGHNIPGTVMSYRVSMKKKRPYIAYIHDAAYRRIPGSLPSFGYDQTKKALDNAASIFTNSLKTLRELEREYKVDGVPLYPGCFPSERISEKRSDFFLFVHFISPRGSFDFLAKLLEKENFNLVVAGGRRWGWGKVLRSYKKFGDRVRFFFEPTEKELSRLYQQARGLIFPEMENFGLSPLEAAACGCPSIVAAGSGVLEVLEKGKEIMAFEEGNTEEFCGAIQTLKRDGQCALQLGKRAWMKAKEHSWDAHVSRLAHNIETY